MCVNVGTGSPTAANACEPVGASLFDKKHTRPVHGDCGEGVDACDDGSRAVDDPDDPPTIGVCGTANNKCTPSASMDVHDTLEHYKWKCLGAPGKSKWTCPGTAGGWTWNCRHGEEDVSGCAREDPARSASCSVPGPSPLATNCMVEGPPCPENAHPVLRDINGDGVLERICECNAGFHDMDESPVTASCVMEPACSQTVINGCDEGDFVQLPDSSNPEQHRWQCSIGAGAKATTCEKSVNCAEAKRWSNNEWSCPSYAQVNCASAGGTWGAGRCEFSSTSCPAVGWTEVATTTSAKTCSGANLSLICGAAPHPFSCTTGSHDSSSAAVEQCRYASQRFEIYPGFPSGGCRTYIFTCTATVTSVECRACSHGSPCNCPISGGLIPVVTCWSGAANSCGSCVGL